MTTFLENLKKQAEKVIEAREPIKPQPIHQDMNNPMVHNPLCKYTIERVINKGEIRLYFAQGWLSEHANIKNRLEQLSAQYSMAGRYWAIADNYDSQLFCDDYLGANFLDVPEETPNEPVSPPTPFDTYKQQCSELITHLGCDVADLALLAVDAFHKQTFGRN